MRVFIIPIGEMGTIAGERLDAHREPIITVKRDSDGQDHLCRKCELREVIPVDSIAMPVRFQRLCAGWHGGQNCMLYAVSSTGGLTIGSNCPSGCYSDEEWYYTIWRNLAYDVDYTVRCAAKGLNAPDECDGGDGEGHDADYPVLVEFEDWVDAQCDALMDSYGLADWEGGV